jgi:hypothetical protein
MNHRPWRAQATPCPRCGAPSREANQTYCRPCTRAVWRATWRRRHPKAARRRRSVRARDLPEGLRWCWWCQESHRVEAFAPMAGTRGYRYSCREGARITMRLWRHRRRLARRATD